MSSKSRERERGTKNDIVGNKTGSEGPAPWGTFQSPTLRNSSKRDYLPAYLFYLFYDASVREGWGIPEGHIQTMVDIRDFLNGDAQ